MDHGFFHNGEGYWQTNSKPSDEVIAGYPEGTIEVPIRPSPDHIWSDDGWVEGEVDMEGWRKVASLGRAQFCIALAAAKILPLSLTVTDEEGGSADRLDIQLDDRDGAIEFPETGALLDVSLGFKETGLSYMGKYAVDGVSGEGPVLTLSIRATAANMIGNIREDISRERQAVNSKINCDLFDNFGHRGQRNIETNTEKTVNLAGRHFKGARHSTCTRRRSARGAVG